MNFTWSTTEIWLMCILHRMVAEEEDHLKTNGSIRNKNPLSKGQRKLKKRHEKSVIILILIVAVFVVCHSFRLGVQTYQTLHSYQSTKEHFIFCAQMDSLPYPVTFLILISFNNLFLVFNSSINFIIYCAVRKSFRERIWNILLQPFKSLARKTSFPNKKSPTTLSTNWCKTLPIHAHVQYTYCETVTK